MKQKCVLVGLPVTLAMLAACASAAPPTQAPTPTAPPTSAPMASPSPASTPTAPPATATPSPSPTPEGPIKIVTGGSLSPSGTSLWYTPGNLTVTQNNAIFELSNPAGGTHNLMISTEVGGEVLAGASVGVDQTAILDATSVSPGTYKMWCSIPEHVAYGMVGTLTIKP